MNQTLLEIQKFSVAVSLQPKQEVKKINKGNNYDGILCFKN